jgi:hypothetical protein
MRFCPAAAVLGIFLFNAPEALSQGCPPGRLMCPNLGSQDGTYLQPREWMMTVSYRHYRAFRDYQGSKALPVPSPPEIYADTRVNLVDVAATYAFTRRLSMSLEFPFEWASRETYVEHDLVTLHAMTSHGAGDTRVIGNFWLLDPDAHLNSNVSVKLGLKTPLGRHSAEDDSFRETGPILRPVDPAIQPGTGGWGIVLGGHGFRRIFENTSVYVDGIYLSNPLEMNGTESPFGDRPEITYGDIGYIIDSVPDQYLARVGIAHTILPKQKLSLTFGVRTDGVPAHDLLGADDGYRLAGYTVSVEPGVVLSRGKNSFSLTVPVTVKGYGSKTEADIRTNNPFGGIVTLADTQLSLSYSRRF